MFPLDFSQDNLYNDNYIIDNIKAKSQAGAA